MNYYVYIMSNEYNNVLYIGVTNNIHKRVYEHKSKFIKGFTEKYNVKKLVYYEVFEDIESAIFREKQLKKKKRSKKNGIISETNPEWHDLFDSIF